MIIDLQDNPGSPRYFQADVFVAETGPAKIMIFGEAPGTTVIEQTLISGLHGATQERIPAAPGKYPIALVDPMRKILQHTDTGEQRVFGLLLIQ